MKRKLLVIRHADTEPGSAAASDHARELTAKGRGDALRVAARIQQLGWTPQRALCSDAARAVQTWNHMTEVFSSPVDTAETGSLYLAGVDDIVDELFGLPEDVAEAAIIGHNPGWQDVVRWLSGVAVRMTPATAVLLEGDGASWADAVRQNKWALHEVVRPEAL